MVTVRKEFTRDIQSQTIALEKDPKVLRVLALGGSSTHGWGLNDPARYSFVAQFCDSLTAEGVPAEPINLGGIGFGSLRSARVLESAARLKPDLILVYCGHNEYWEYPVVRKLAEQGLREKSESLLSGLRMYQLVNDYLRKKEAKDFLITPELDGSYEALSGEVEKEMLAEYEKNLERIYSVADSIGSILFVSTLGRNLLVNPADTADWLHDAAKIDANLSEKDAKRLQLLERESVKAMKHDSIAYAIKILKEATTIDPGYSRTWHLLGFAQLANGDSSAAYQSLTQHIDATKRLATTEINNQIAGLAEKHKNPVVDSRKRLEAAVPFGLTGYDLFIDSMHPNRIGHSIIASSFLERFRNITISKD